MKSCSEVILKTAHNGDTLVTVGEPWPWVGEVMSIHVTDQGVVLSGKRGWALFPWHRVVSVGGEGLWL